MLIDLPSKSVPSEQALVKKHWSTQLYHGKFSPYLIEKTATTVQSCTLLYNFHNIVNSSLRKQIGNKILLSFLLSTLVPIFLLRENNHFQYGRLFHTHTCIKSIRRQNISSESLPNRKHNGQKVGWVICTSICYNGCSEFNASYFTVLAYDTRGRCWYDSRGWNFLPIFHYTLICNRWQQRARLAKWHLTGKCVWSKGVSPNSSTWKNCTHWHSSILAECQCRPNSGCEHSEAVGSAFQQWWQWCERQALWNEECLNQLIHTDESSVGYDQVTVYRAEYWLHCGGNNGGSIRISQSLHEVGPTGVYAGTERTQLASTSGPIEPTWG